MAIVLHTILFVGIFIGSVVWLLVGGASSLFFSFVLYLF